MEQKESRQTFCKSVFKSGKNTTSKREFTKKWIELINRVEKNKGNTAVKR